MLSSTGKCPEYSEKRLQNGKCSVLQLLFLKRYVKSYILERLDLHQNVNWLYPIGSYQIFLFIFSKFSTISICYVSNENNMVKVANKEKSTQRAGEQPWKSRKSLGSRVKRGEGGSEEG